MWKGHLTTWMSQEVTKWLVNGFFHLLLHGIYWGYNPLILTIDPNFQRDIQAALSLLVGFPRIRDPAKCHCKSRSSSHQSYMNTWDVRPSSNEILRITNITPEIQHSPWKMMLGRWVSFWDCLLLGAMFNLRGVAPENPWRHNGWKTWCRLPFWGPNNSGLRSGA